MSLGERLTKSHFHHLLLRKNGDFIKIKSGYDYGGQEENIKAYYKEAVRVSVNH